MKKNFIIQLILFMVIVLSCDKEEDIMLDVDLGVGISYIDGLGQDLLDPNNPNSYDTDQFKIYHYKNGEKVLFQMANLDNPKGYFVFKEANMEYYRLAISEPNSYTEEESEEYETLTLLELSSTETDTINIVIRKGNNFLETRKVYYNNILVWAWEDAKARNFIIEK
ncbi:MAG: hypothetical protein JEY96_19405 [Bacteroidales bacterium]|nr:hypothetical protein [Bacteroidales bacterium]